MNPDQQRTDLSNAMLGMLESFAPVIDTADGMKADLERRGWSPTAAEQVSLAWLMGAMAQIWQVQK